MTVVDPPFEAGVSALRRLGARLARHGNLYDVVKSAAQVFAIRVVGAGLTYASTILLARWLGAFDFGIYAYVLVIITLLGLALSFGFSSAGLRLVPDYLGRKRWRRLTGFLVQSYAIILALSALGAVTGAALVVALRGFIAPYYFMPLLVGLLCVPIWTLLNQGEAMAPAFGWVNLAYVPGYIARPLLLIVFVGGLAIVGHHPNATVALWAMIGACGIAAAGQGVLVLAGIRRRVGKVAGSFHTRYWVLTSLSFLMIDGFRLLLDNTDVLMIGRLLDPHSVAIYFAAIRTAGLVAFVSFAMIALAVPKFAEINATGTREELQAFVSGVLKMMFWPSLATAIALAALGPFVLSLFGTGFEAGYPTMLIVLTGLVLRAASGPVEYLLNMTGHQRDTLRVYACAAVGTVVLDALLIPTLGIMGAAIGTYTAMLSGNLWLYFLVKKRLGVHAFIFRLPGRRATEPVA